MADLDISDIINQIVGQAAADNDLLKGLKDNPATTLENITGIDIPNEQIDDIINKMGGIDGLVADFTKEDGGGIEGVVQAAEQAIAGEAGEDLLGQAGNIIGGILGGK